MRQRLAALLAGYAGLDPPPWAVAARLRERADALGLAEDAYVARLGADGDELGRLVELLRVGETRFFRHRAQLDLLVRRVLPSLRAPVRAWSAGCASGEEAWTLAMLLSEHGLSFTLTASDLSPAALQRARRGSYPAARVQAEVPAALVKRYFRRSGDERVIHERLRPHVRFVAHNLLSPPPTAQPFDLVLCRNVLIYFDEEKRAQVVHKLVRALAPGGWLLVGYSETLRGVPELSGEAHAIYRKHEHESRRGDADERPRRATPRPRATPVSAAPLPSPTTAVRLPPGAAPAPARARTAPLRTLALHGEYSDGRRLAGELRPLIGSAAALVDLDGASFLGDEAARVLKRAAEAAPRLQLKATRTAVRRWLQRHGIRTR